MNMRLVAFGSVGLGVVLFALGGVWALTAPHSFFEQVATYPPYNRHLFHDLGAFQLGIAAALVAGVVGRPALATGLWGGAVGATAHAVSHWLDADLGGRTSDQWLLSIVALVLLVGLVAAESLAKDTARSEEIVS